MVEFPAACVGESLGCSDIRLGVGAQERSGPGLWLLGVELEVTFASDLPGAFLARLDGLGEPLLRARRIFLLEDVNEK